MIVQLEEGDRVFERGDYGGESLEIVGLRQKGVVVENSYGERLFLGKNQLEPAPYSLAHAKYLTLPK